jgi:hypothetical protein
MCRIQMPVAPSTMPRLSAGPRARAGRRTETDGLLRELAYVYRLTERVREEVLAGDAPRKTRGIR